MASAPSAPDSHWLICAQVIASDGEATDGDIAAALRPLRDLPAWVVVRLCTDDDRVVQYWNEIDEDLELDMDVLDRVEIKFQAPTPSTRRSRQLTG